MSQPTLVRNIGVPEVRENYVDSYYALLEQVDRDLVQYGDNSDRPTNPPNGYTFYNLDSLVLERFNSSVGDWVTIAGLGEEGSPIEETIYAEGGEFGELVVDEKDVDEFTDDLRADVDQNAQDISQIDDGFSDDIAALESAVEQNESDISDNSSAISSLETDVSDNSSDISSLETDVSDNSSDISSLETDVGTNANDINTLQSELNTVESDVSSNSSDIDSLESDVDSNSSDISSLQSNKADRNGDNISASSLDAGTVEARNTLIVPDSF